MNKLLSKLIDINDKRSKILRKNIFGSIFLRLVDVLVDFLLVPISLAYLTQTDYGIWLTINSIVNWMNFFDIGISHGYRNKLTIALSNKDYSLAKTYTSTVYAIIGAISLVLGLICSLSIPFVNWENMLNTPNNYNNQLTIVMLVVVASFTIRLTLKIITSVFLAHQMPFWRNLINTITKIFTLGLIVLAGYFTNKNLVVFALIQSLIPLLILVISTILFFNKKYKHIRPNISFFNKDVIKDLFGLGINFFVIQLAATMLFASDNFIIAHVLSPSEVAPYMITLKYFGIFSILFIIIKTPYWSAFTDAYQKGDYKWIKKSISTLNYIWFAGILFTFVLFIAFRKVKIFWVGPDIQIPLLLVYQCTLFVLLQAYSSIYTSFLNGIGKLKLVMFTGVFTLIINIPLSIYFAVNLNMGSAGILLATNCSLLLYVITRKIQYHKIIDNKAYGIWNK